MTLNAQHIVILCVIPRSVIEINFDMEISEHGE